MRKQNLNFPHESSLMDASSNSSMDAKQIIDSLTAHISLYNSSSSSRSVPGNPNPRSQILKWFSSLTVHQRQSHLTIVDQKFAQILLQMQRKLRSNGHGFFIILPDIPSNDGLPSLCYRRSHGVLARASESNESERLVYDSIRLFNSKEGEKVDECSCSADCLDSVVVCEGFVENVDGFVAAMDGVSNAAFLRGEESGLGLDWVELEWLKAKGYYSIEAFVANRLEVALRLAWMNLNSGKKRGVKLKEKASTAGVAANVYWRKKGCLDWWGKLDAATRREVFRVALGKSAKSLTAEILKTGTNTSEDQILIFGSGVERLQRFNYTLSSQQTVATSSGVVCSPASASGKTSSITYMIHGLYVLQEIITILLACQHSEFDKERVFLSSLASISTISDFIFRKLRGLLMVISLDCTKLELLEGNSNFPTKKSKEKISAATRRKKGGSRNMKRLNPIPIASRDDIGLNKAAKSRRMIQDHGYGLPHTKVGDIVKSNWMAGTLQKKGPDTEIPSSAVVMGPTEGSVRKNVQSGSRKCKKESNEVKKFGLNDPKVGTCQTRGSRISSSSQVEAAKSDSVSENSVMQNIANNVSTGNDKLLPLSPFTGGPMGEDKLVQSNEEDYSTSSQGPIEEQPSGSAEGPIDTGLDHYSDRVKEYHSTSSSSEIMNNTVDSSIMSPHMLVVGSGDVICTEDKDHRNCGHVSETDSTSLLSDVRTKAIDSEEEVTPIQEQKSRSIYDTQSINSSGCPSYEWPRVYPLHFPSINSHLPPATDRLHLDVGHNWQNHFRQSFVPTLHQVRNTDNGCSRILSRQLPMSLDWPPMVRNGYGLAPTVACSHDSGFISRRQSFHQGFTAQNMQHNVSATDDDRIYSRDFVDLSDLTNSQELIDEQDNHWISEEEYEVHAVSGMDYSQYFGGGVMYWNPSDHPGTSFSRPPSLSSDDSSWAWREADMNRAVDDMVAFSSSYSTNGLTSPSAASFCSPFDPLATGHQAVGFVIPGSEVTGKLLHSSSAVTDSTAEENVSGSLSSLPGDSEVKTGDSLPYPILRPIIIPNMSRERSRSEFKRSHDLKSPCVPPNRREQPRIKRPPSPVVLCVPRAPHPPPPSPVGNSRKHRGFPTVRSGSSSPRHWGVRGLFHEGISFEEACVRMDGSEVVWPSWRNKSLSAHAMVQPVPGSLLQDRLIAMSQLTRDQEHPDVALPLQLPDLLNCPNRKASLSLMHSLLHDEIDNFCKRVAAENLSRKPYINWAIKRVARSLQVLWPRSRTNIFGSNATGLSLPSSDVDLVVCLPPVRNLEPIKEAGILEGRNGIKETCLQHAARYLANQEWVKSDSLKIVENTAIPIIMLVVEVPRDLVTPAASAISTVKELTEEITEGANNFRANLVNSEASSSLKCSNMNNGDGKDMKSIRIDISFKSPSHTGLQTTELVKELTEQFPAATPLALVLKTFLADRSLDQSYSGGLSSYCLVLLITRFLQHEYHHGRPINQNFGSLLMDFFYFFGNVFDPRQMCISVRGSGIYINRERGYSIDPIYIDDPLFPTNNVGRNCFRIHQCIKSLLQAFADAYSTLESELKCLPNTGESTARPVYNLLPKIIPSIGLS
ncbi:uncharacterized protein LOC127801296 isoform X2 [Diospyros lotus]|uniref:uncharacterized protein LOC127801296 isoform X2 n=1 Tax=Diospyros lotus TaxID=55363 RepID=UPI002250347C|nr:uncharacterized protein LOC127801296 isoform X2 [Diospyros lotus]